MTLCAAVLVSGCAASARQRPVEGSPVATSGDTLENARRALQGTWALVSLNVTAPDGRKAAVEAAGTLVSDAFGNLSVEYRMSPAGQKTLESVGITTPNPVVTTSRPRGHRRGQEAASPMSRRRPTPSRSTRNWPPAATTRSRSSGLAIYAVDADGLLTLTTRYDDGTDAAVSRWKKGSSSRYYGPAGARLLQTSGDVRRRFRALSECKNVWTSV